MNHEGKKRQRDGEGQEGAVYIPNRPAPQHEQLKKHQKRNKGLEVVFDPKAHKEYLTGFHKRKVARRKEALQNLEKRARQQRLEERAERRQEKKEELKRLGADISASEDDDGEAEEAEQKVYTSGQLTSTVTVVPIRSHSDSEEEPAGQAGSGAEDGEEAKEEGQEGGGGGRQQQQQPPWRRQQHGGGDEGQQGEGQEATGYKLSKTALRIMTKTKMKIEGKRGKGGSSGKGGSGGGKKGGGSGKKGGGKRGGKGGGKGRR